MLEKTQKVTLQSCLVSNLARALISILDAVESLFLETCWELITLPRMGLGSRKERQIKRGRRKGRGEKTEVLLHLLYGKNILLVILLLEDYNN